MGESCRFWDRDEEKLSRNAGTAYFLSFLLLFDFTLLLLFIISVCICVEVREELLGVFLSFHPYVLRARPQVLRLGSKHPHWLHQFAGP